jgi:hypothetical protein
VDNLGLTKDVLLGNKVDKEFSRQVTTEEGKAFAERMGTLFVECSAKTKVGVQDTFRELVEKVRGLFRFISLPGYFCSEPISSIRFSRPV